MSDKDRTRVQWKDDCKGFVILGAGWSLILMLLHMMDGLISSLFWKANLYLAWGDDNIFPHHKLSPFGLLKIGMVMTRSGRLFVFDGFGLILALVGHLVSEGKVPTKHLITTRWWQALQYYFFNSRLFQVLFRFSHEGSIIFDIFAILRNSCGRKPLSWRMANLLFQSVRQRPPHVRDQLITDR